MYTIIIYYTEKGSKGCHQVIHPKMDGATKDRFDGKVLDLVNTISGGVFHHYEIKN